MRAPLALLSLAVVPLAASLSCSNSGTDVAPRGDASVPDTTVLDVTAEVVPDAVVPDVSPEVIPEVSPPPFDGPFPPTFCDLPGSVLFGSGGSVTIVAGGVNAPSLSWLKLPSGFCAHYFAHADEVRQLRVAPGGELFVAAPSTPTAGGASGGPGAVVVFFDDNHDGYADGDSLPHSDGSAQNLTLFTSVASVQGLMFTPGFFYFQNGTQIMKVAYTTGQRGLKGTAESVVDVSMANGMYVSSDHWPKR